MARVLIRPMEPELWNIVPPHRLAKHGWVLLAMGRTHELGADSAVGSTAIVEHVTAGAGMDVLAVSR